MRGQKDDRTPQQWPTTENLYEALNSQDMTYMPLELRHWVETVQMLNSQEDFEVKGENFNNSKSLQWLPSTALMALGQLRKQDPVSLFEDQHVPFAALFNFTRNFASQFDAPLEIAFADGFKMVDKLFINKVQESKQHGKIQNRRGLVVIDPDYKRGSEAFRCQRAVVGLRKHWYAATVMVFYPLRPEFLTKSKKFINTVRQADGSLDLLKAELYVETPNWDEWSEQPKWRGCGVLISSPPYTAGERIQACLTVLAEELGTVKGGDYIHVKVEKVG
jgi:23S rRNA A2030 N6-methylase RlmJ